MHQIHPQRSAYLNWISNYFAITKKSVNLNEFFLPGLMIVRMWPGSTSLHWSLDKRKPRSEVKTMEKRHSPSVWASDCGVCFKEPATAAIAFSFPSTGLTSCSQSHRSYRMFYLGRVTIMHRMLSSEFLQNLNGNSSETFLSRAVMNSNAVWQQPPVNLSWI